MPVTLGVNIDHIATLRNSRGGLHPDPLTAALLAEAHGADGITAHLREDRRHIRDADIQALKAGIHTRLNLEMAATAEMQRIALRTRPWMCTLVPERRLELTTEGGLDVISQYEALRSIIKALREAEILVSLFIAPELAQVEASARIGASHVELHTGPYAHAWQAGHTESALTYLRQAGERTRQLGLGLNAGHGLTVENVAPVAAIPGMEELNIGHSLIARATFVGLGQAVVEMKACLSAAVAAA